MHCGRHPWRRETLLLLLFAGLAVALTWPLARDLAEGIPLGTETAATVPLASLWSLWWNADRLAHGYAGYWDAPIFHPVDDVFAFSETHFLAGLFTAAVLLLTGSLPAAYNLFLLLALAANGWLGHRLLLALDLSALPAAFGGALVAVLPIIHQELGVLALVPLGGILLTLLSTVRFVRDPRPGAGALLGASLGITYLLCGYYGLMTGLLLALTLPFLVLPLALRRRSLWTGLLAAALVGAALILPVALPQRSAVRDQGFARSTETVSRHSARPDHYLRTAWPSLLPAPGGTAPRPSSRAFWPGSLRVLLALVDAGWALGRATARRWALWLTGLALLGFLLSLGPHGPPLLHPALQAVVPGYGQMRSLFRFAVVAQLAVALLAAHGLEAIRRAAGSRWRRGWLAVCLVGLLAAGELWPRTGEIRPLPSLDLDLAWIEWIESETREDAVLAFIPFPRGRTAADYQGTTQWMYWQMRHGRPMVNGYSSFFPASFRKLKEDLAAFPDAAGLRRLAEHGVDYCVVHRAFVSPEAARAVAGAAPPLELVASDPASAIDIYRLVRRR